jgi:hypothetical protein
VCIEFCYNPATILQSFFPVKNNKKHSFSAFSNIRGFLLQAPRLKNVSNNLFDKFDDHGPITNAHARIKFNYSIFDN